MTDLRRGSAIDELVRFVLMFDDPEAKLNEMFPDEYIHPSQVTSSNTTSPESDMKFELADDSSETTNSGSYTGSHPSHISQQNEVTTLREDTFTLAAKSLPQSNDGNPMYWCGETGCNAFRKVFEGIRPYRYLLQHYTKRHSELWFDAERLVAHTNGVEGEKCKPMRLRTERDRPRSRRGPRKLRSRIG